MSHDIAQCPYCGKFDFVLKENGEWECLNPKCRKKHDRLKTESDTKPETKVDAVTVLIAAFVVALFLMFTVAPQNGYRPLPHENTTTSPFR